MRFRLLLAAAMTAVAMPAASREPTPLIARAELFGNPTRTGARLSPDGMWISFLAPRDGVLNVWVAPADAPTRARPLTVETTRPIRYSFWSPDSRQVLFINDRDGDENYQLYAVDAAGGAARALTTSPKAVAQLIGTSTTIRDRILIGLNDRDPRWHDPQLLDLATGTLTRVFENTGYSRFLADDRLALRVAVKSRPDGGVDYFRIDGDRVEATPFVSVPFEDAGTTLPIGFTVDGRTLYWSDSRDRDTGAIAAQDVATGRMTMIASDPKSDLFPGLFNPRTGLIESYAGNYLRFEQHPVGDAIAADLAFLKAQDKGEFRIDSRTDADDRWIVSFDPVSAPASTWLYDRGARSLSPLWVARPELVGAPLVAQHPVVIPARDGLRMVSYLTLPRDADRDGDGRPERPVPMVMLVHGGPWARDGYGFSAAAQWLANRGYAVLQVNFRGSTGFGKAFANAGNLQWGAKMHDDLLDALGWAVGRGVTTRDTVAIMGASYGGYATLAALAFTPETFACGVDIVGPSNLFTLLETIPPHWEAARRQQYRRIGDPTTAEGRRLLEERSPLNRVDAIRRPLLIGQGANDPRVNVRESDRIVAAMRARGIPVTYVLFPDEGHGFARPANAIAFNAVTEDFLSRCLGGRAEPIGGALAASSAEIRAGGERYATARPAAGRP